MLTLDYTLSLLNLQEVIVKKVTINDKSAVIDIEMPKKQHTCPRCCAELRMFMITETGLSRIFLHSA